jgi:murein DD-endopeptidase MepM/ murein hydrolase activator NlpD
MGGAIPGSQLEREGAAFTSAANFLPTEAAGLGAGAIKDIESQRLQDILGLESDRPQTIMDAVNKLLDESYSRQQDALKLAGGATGTSAKHQLRSLANGQIGTYVNGKLVSVSGPPKAASASSVKLQARSLANGQVQWFDPTTGKAVGKPVGPPRQKGKGSAPSNKLQARSLANGQIQWFNPKTGKPVGKPVGPPRAPRSSGSTSNRPYNMTPTQIRRAKGDAYQIAQAWSKNGMKDGDGNPVKAQDLLKEMINAGQIPFDIAVRALAKFYAPAKKWYNPKKKTTNVSNVTEIQNSPGYEPSKGIVQLPTRFTGTHVTDGLGWGTKTAHDFMAPPGAPVNSPVSGTILYFHSNGAQGGGSMLIRGDDGYEYWLGHIEGGITGGRITAGQQIAVIANQSVSAPHVHIDRRPLGATT